jgi:beta-N-acetylhexosaminidase
MKADNHLNGDCFESVMRFVEDGKISENEIDQKVERVLSMKEKFGLFGADLAGGRTGLSSPSSSGVSAPTSTKSDPDAMFKDPEVIELNTILAKKTTLIASDKKKLLPLTTEQKILLIEQERPTPNDIDSHSAMLYNKCLKETDNLTYLEVAYSYDKDDINRIREAIKSHDLIVMTNFYARGTAQNCDIVEEIASDKSKKLVLITNTPYPTSIPNSADTVIITFGQETANLAFVAKMLFGRETPEGKWPIAYRQF